MNTFLRIATVFEASVVLLIVAGIWLMLAIIIWEIRYVRDHALIK